MNPITGTATGIIPAGLTIGFFFDLLIQHQYLCYFPANVANTSALD